MCSVYYMYLVQVMKRLVVLIGFVYYYFRKSHAPSGQVSEQRSLYIYTYV